MNCTLDYTELAWEGTIQAVADGTFDTAGGGITITEEREEVVDFTDGYINVEQRMLVSLGEDRFTGPDDFAADSSLTIGSQTGTTNYDAAVALVGEDRVVAFETFGFAVQALLTGDVDAVVIDETAGQGYQGENKDATELVGASLSSDSLGVPFPNGSDLVGPFNAAIASMKADGSLFSLGSVYFTDAFAVTYDDIGDGAYAEEVAEPVFGGTLRYALEAETDGINPTVNRLAVSGHQMALSVFDTLVSVTDDPCGCVFVPVLAESWTHSDDYMTWDFKIREGVKFHDGTSLTAEAVVFAVERQLADFLISLALKPLFTPENGVELVDDMTVRFNLKRSHVDFPVYMAGQLGYVPSLEYMKAAIDDPTLNQAPVGTGPFMFDSREQDYMTRFVRNPDWWQGDVYLDAIEFYIYTDTVLAADALAVGDVDAVHSSNLDAILALREVEGAQIYETDDAEETFGMLNASKAPFDDIRARQALALSVAKDDYLEFIGQGILRM